MEVSLFTYHVPELGWLGAPWASLSLCAAFLLSVWSSSGTW